MALAWEKICCKTSTGSIAFTHSQWKKLFSPVKDKKAADMFPVFFSSPYSNFWSLGCQCYSVFPSLHLFSYSVWFCVKLHPGKNFFMELLRFTLVFFPPPSLHRHSKTHIAGKINFSHSLMKKQRNREC